MPPDYSSTAAAPIISPTSESAPIRPSFSRIQSTRRRLSIHDERLSYKEQLIRSADLVQRKVLSTYKALTPLQRILAGGGVIILAILGILLLVFNHRIFSWLSPIADKWRTIPGGWLILFALICFSAFPPIIGYSTALAVAGFLYGFPHGWFVAAAGNVLGSLASFIACRSFLSSYVHRLVGEDKRFAALALVLKHDGLKILVMIRLAPLPYSLSNAAMSTFHTVSAPAFALATLLATPKLLIHIFIGSRLADLVEKGEKMDLATKLVNYTSIVGGGLLGLGLGYYIYQRTMMRARELELEENATLSRTPGSGTGWSGSGDYFVDGSVDQAAGFDDDDISLWDNEDEAYQDEEPDEEIIVAGEHADEEAMIGSKLPK